MIVLLLGASACTTVRASANLLNGIYKNSPKNLGEWGFEVNDTPAKKKTDTPKP